MRVSKICRPWSLLAAVVLAGLAPIALPRVAADPVEVEG